MASILRATPTEIEVPIPLGTKSDWITALNHRPCPVNPVDVIDALQKSNISVTTMGRSLELDALACSLHWCISLLVTWQRQVTERKGKGLPELLSTLRWRWLREWFVVIFVALLAAFAIRATLVQTYFIPSESMTPTLEVGDRLMVYKLAFTLGDVDRGDLVVFNRPANMGNADIRLRKESYRLEGERIRAEGRRFT